LAEIPGIRPMKRYPQVTRQSYYCFSFRYDSAAWGGIPGTAFRRALGAELGMHVGGTYEPLNNCSLYKPHTKRRHHLSEEYWQAIDPARFELPVCQKAHEDEGVTLSHTVLLAEREDMDEVVRAVEKLYENRFELAGLSQ
jgi:L-glutamine:2-deoxy-scyllo-inosose/3-amino-2,3-dideoxy-scyllo-inosose aminotransferase